VCITNDLHRFAATKFITLTSNGLVASVPCWGANIGHKDSVLVSDIPYLLLKARAIGASHSCPALVTRRPAEMEGALHSWREGGREGGSGRRG